MSNIGKILDGVDKTECEYCSPGFDTSAPDYYCGWWETSAGAEFGAKKLAEVEGFFQQQQLRTRDEGYQTGKSDAFKEAKMLVGTYGVKDIDSEETKIYIRAREEAVEQLRKYEPHCGNWSWQNAYKEIQSLTTQLEASEKREKELVVLVLRANDIFSDRPNISESELAAWGVLADKTLTGSEPIQGENDGT